MEWKWNRIHPFCLFCWSNHCFDLTEVGSSKKIGTGTSKVKLEISIALFRGITINSFKSQSSNCLLPVFFSTECFWKKCNMAWWFESPSWLSFVCPHQQPIAGLHGHPLKYLLSQEKMCDIQHTFFWIFGFSSFPASEALQRMNFKLIWHVTGISLLNNDRVIGTAWHKQQELTHSTWKGHS